MKIKFIKNSNVLVNSEIKKFEENKIATLDDDIANKLIKEGRAEKIESGNKQGKVLSKQSMET